MSVLRWIIEQAVRQAAQQQLHSTAEEMLSQEPLPPPPLADVVICFSHHAEAVGVLDRLEEPILETRETSAGSLTLTHGNFAGQRVAVVVFGMQTKRNAAVWQSLAAERTPRWLISTGFAVGLASEIKRRSFVLAEEIVTARGLPFRTDLFLDRDSLATLKNVHIGRLVSTPQSPATVDEKQTLATEHQAIAADLDSWELLQSLPRGEFAPGTPTAVPLPRCLSVRIVSDALDDRPSAELETMLKQPTWSGKLGAAAGALFRRPSIANELWALQNESLVLADRLAKFLAGVVPQLT